MVFFLWVLKKKAAHAIEERAKSSKSFFVNSRWLGGMLTNWSTIEKSLLQLYRIEREQSEGMWTTIKKKKSILAKKSS